MAEIRAQIEEEVALTQGRTVLELLERHNLVRILWALGVGFFAIWSGHNAILLVSKCTCSQASPTIQGFSFSGIACPCIMIVNKIQRGDGY